MPANPPEQLRLFDFDARMAPEGARLAAAGRLADALAARLGEPVRLTVHDNRSTMVSFRRRLQAVHYRVHHLFLDAPGDVVKALAAFAARWVRGTRRREAGRRIDAWVKANRGRVATPEPAALGARGLHHDLAEVFERLNAEHFGGTVQARIGWGAAAAGVRRSIKTGVYFHDARMIRIHPSLDRAEVPLFYVEAVVFHEMLHQVVPAVERGGRRLVHGPEFRRRERAFPAYARARDWETANLPLLLGRRSR